MIFHLRAEDLPRLQAEWFRDERDEIVCDLEITKDDLNKHRTTHERQDAVSSWRQMNLRRSKGLLIFPIPSGPGGNHLNAQGELEQTPHIRTRRLRPADFVKGHDDDEHSPHRFPPDPGGST